MHHLIVAATKIEVNPIISLIQPKYIISSNYYKLSDNINLLIAGIGQYNTIRSLTEYTNKFGKPISILNIGIAGTYKNALKINTLIKINKDIAYDQKVVDNNQISSWTDASLPEATSNIFESILPSYYADINLKEAIGLTSDTLSDKENRINHITQTYNAACESMEGAAVFYLANHYKIPSMQIRAISNSVGETNKSKWKIKESIEELNRFVNEQLIGKLF